MHTPSLMPEEQVRRWIIGELVASGVARERIAVEYSIMVGGRRLRIDLAVFAARTTSIIAIVECKAPSVPLSRSTLDQAAAYNTVVGARYIITTNGHSTLIYDVAKKCFIEQLPSDL